MLLQCGGHVVKGSDADQRNLPRMSLSQDSDLLI